MPASSSGSTRRSFDIMPQIFQQIASTDLNIRQGNYIYELTSLGSSTLAAITSLDSLHLFDAATLQIKSTQPSVHQGITCLKTFNNNVLVTAGRDGLVKIWDTRMRTSVSVTAELAKEGKKLPLLSLAASRRYNAAAAGEELTDHMAGVIVWDIRTNRITRHYTESHADDVTELQFDPASSSLLLSGSTDGLVNIYDLKQAAKSSSDADDDEALFQVINHGSSIHRAGFLHPVACHPELDIFALSHDEIMTMYCLNNPSSINTEEPARSEDEEEEKSAWGDVRQKLGCDYVVNIIPQENGGAGGTFVAGSHQQQWVDLMPLRSEWSGKGKNGRMSGWKVVNDDGIRLAGGHGEEIVRCVHIMEATRTIYTGGEDGLVKVWGGPQPAAERTPMAAPEPHSVSEAADVPKPERREKKSGKQSRKVPYTTERKYK